MGNRTFGKVKESEPALKEAIKLIKRFEGFRGIAYFDYKQYSCGFGTRCSKGEVITLEEAEKRLEEAVRARYNLVKDLNITDNQKAALTSFIYNTGGQGILKYVQRGDHQSAIYIMNKTVYAGGKKLNGLVIRRAEEVKLYKL